MKKYLSIVLIAHLIMTTLVFQTVEAEDSMPKADVTGLQQFENVQVDWFTRTGAKTEDSTAAAYGYIPELWGRDFVLEYTFHCTQASNPGIWKMYYGADTDFANDQSAVNKYVGRVGYYKEYQDKVSWLMSFTAKEYSGLSAAHKAFGYPRTKFDKANWIQANNDYDVYISYVDDVLIFGMKESQSEQWYYYTDTITADKAGTLYISQGGGITGTYDNIVLYGEKPVRASADREEYPTYAGAKIGVTFSKSISDVPDEVKVKKEDDVLSCTVEKNSTDNKSFSIIHDTELEPLSEYTIDLSGFVADDGSIYDKPLTIKTNHGVLTKPAVDGLKKIAEPTVEWTVDGNVEYGRLSSIWSNYYVIEYDIEIDKSGNDSVNAIVFGNSDYDFNDIYDSGKYFYFVGMTDGGVCGHKNNDTDLMRKLYTDNYDGKTEQGGKYHIYSAFIDNTLYFAYKPAEADDNRYVWYSEKYDAAGRKGGLYIINNKMKSTISNISLYSEDGYAAAFGKIKALEKLNAAENTNDVYDIVEGEPFNIFENEVFLNLSDNEKIVFKDALLNMILDKKKELGGFKTDDKVTFSDVEDFEKYVRDSIDLSKLIAFEADKLIGYIENNEIEGVDITDEDYVKYKNDIISTLKKIQTNKKIKYYKSENEFAGVFAEAQALVVINNAQNREEAKAAIDKYGEALKLNLAEYKKQNEMIICSALVNKNFKTGTEVQSAIDRKISEIKNESKNTKNENSPGKSGRDSSGGGSVPSVSVTNESIVRGNEQKTNTDCPFNDLDGVAWAKDAIDNLYAKKIISGVTKTSFEPTRNITRAEFVTILIKALKIENTATNDIGFNDIKGDEWYCNTVKTAALTGIVNGDENGNFNPDMPITRQDAALMVYRAYKDLLSADNDDQRFADCDDISEYAREAVGVLAENKIINGRDDNKFDPKMNITRAEAAVIVYRVINN